MNPGDLRGARDLCLEINRGEAQTQALGMQQQEIQSLLQQALKAQQSGDLSVAGQVCRQVLRRESGQVDALHLMGLVEKKAGHLESAAHWIRRALAANSNQPQALNNLGNILADLGQTREAIEQYRAAISLDPFFADPWHNMGLAQGAGKQYYQAIESHKKAVSLNPDDPRFLNALGIAHKEVDQLEEAIVAYRRALQVSPDNFRVLHNLALALKLSETLEESIETYNKALELAPETPEIHYNRANAYYENGSVKRAIEGFEAAIDIQPDFVLAHDTLNQYYWEDGDLDNFASSFAPAIKRRPMSQELRAQYARSLELSGRWGEALEVLDVALAEVGDDPRIHHRMGRVLYNLTWTDEAAYHFDLAVKGSPDDKEIRIDYTKLLVTVGEYQKALQHLKHVERIDPDEQEMWAFRGMCWRFLGDDREAWLNDYDRYLVARMIDVPEGYDDLEHFISVLRGALVEMHRTRKHPLEQTVQGGTQTPGRLFHKPVKVIQDLRATIENNIRLYIDALPDDPLHPLCRRKSKDFRFTGSWSVRLRSEGFHINHTHPAGWISGPTYIEVPDVIRDDDPDHRGWVKFGESGLNLEPERDKVHVWVKPVVGLNAIFPSYMWHGTAPFESEQYRMTTPMDVHPM